MTLIGDLGEELVKQWLKHENHRILEQNWHCRWGEIDLIAQHKNSQAIAFVEVKTRSQGNWDANGVLAVDGTKQEKIITTASLFLAKYPQLAELPCSFDVALVSYVLLKSQGGKEKSPEMKKLDLGVPVIMEQYQLTIENYLQSAFDA